jgi:signal transduction histidine kinase
MIHLSRLLADRRVEILERWTQRIGRDHVDKELSRGELWDHLPLFFDEVLAALRAEEASGGEPPTSNGSTASVAHGTQRLRVGFDLAEVIREYEILEGGITVEVEDGCGGLPQENTTELFEPFVQRGENRTGFGLGLAIVKQALEAHGGRVSVRNLPGKGCVFLLDLSDSKDA